MTPTPNPQVAPITDDNDPPPVRRRPNRPDPDARPPAREQPTTPPPGPGRAVTPHRPDNGVFGALIADQAPPTGRQIPNPDTDETISLNDLLLAQLNRPDPMDDWVSDSTRMLRWVQLTINFVATQTGRTRQDVLRDAILGIRPLPGAILDRYYTHLYGQQRPTEAGGSD